MAEHLTFKHDSVKDQPLCCAYPQIGIANHQDEDGIHQVIVLCHVCFTGWEIKKSTHIDCNLNQETVKHIIDVLHRHHKDEMFGLSIFSGPEYDALCLIATMTMSSDTIHSDGYDLDYLLNTAASRPAEYGKGWRVLNQVSPGKWAINWIAKEIL